MKEAIRTSWHVHMGQECGVLLGSGHTLLSGGKRSSVGCPEGVGKEMILAGMQAEFRKRSMSRGITPSPCHLEWDLIVKKGTLIFA